MELSHQLDFQSFINPTPISQGFLSKVRKFEHKSRPNEHFAVKTILGEDDEIKRVLNFWHRIQNIPKKPKAIPKFLGTFQDPYLYGNHTNLVFEFHPIAFQEILKNSSHNNFIVSFKQLHSCFKSLVNCFAFLQTMGICHRNLTPSDLYVDLVSNHVYIIDFDETKDSLVKASPELKYQLMSHDLAQYFSPELHHAFSIQNIQNDKKAHSGIINPFKSDVFSLALIILQLGNGELPIREIYDPSKWKENIKSSLEKMHRKYEAKMGTKEEREILQEFVLTLKECLRFKPEDRLDFKQLFMKMFQITDDTVRKLVLLDEGENAELLKSSGNQAIEKNYICDDNKTTKVSQNPINQNEVYDDKGKINKFSQKIPLKELEKPKHNSNSNSKSNNNDAIQNTKRILEEDQKTSIPAFKSKINEANKRETARIDEMKNFEINFNHGSQVLHPVQINFNQRINPIQINIPQISQDSIPISK